MLKLSSGIEILVAKVAGESSDAVGHGLGQNSHRLFSFPELVVVEWMVPRERDDFHVTVQHEVEQLQDVLRSVNRQTRASAKGGRTRSIRPVPAIN